MDNVLASYNYRYGNDAWHYELHPNRVVAIGNRGPERHEQVFELRSFFEYPNRNTRVESKHQPGVAVVAALMFVLIGILIIIALIVEDIVPEGPALGFMGATIGLAFPVYYLILAARRTRQFLTVVHFKQHDNKDAFAIWLIGDENREGFENFVDKTRHVIRGLHEAK